MEVEHNIPVPPPAAPKATSKPAPRRAREAAHPPVHESRAFETWDASAAHDQADTPWEHAASLTAPPARPGFDQRWVRVALKGDEDFTNTSRKFREGWRPRLASTVPPKFNPPRIATGKYEGCIGVEGMLLCERPATIGAKQREAIREKTDRITQGIEAELQAQSHPNMAITQERRSVAKRNIRLQDD